MQNQPACRYSLELYKEPGGANKSAQVWCTAAAGVPAICMFYSFIRGANQRCRQGQKPGQVRGKSYS